MPKCWVLCLYIHPEGMQLCRFELPPMTLPQNLLPEGAQFQGVGAMGEDDVYLYRIKGKAEGKTQETDPQLLDCLMTLARKDAPQDFVLSGSGGEWKLETKDLEQDVF